MGFTLGARNLDNIRNYLYDVIGRVNKVSKQHLTALLEGLEKHNVFLQKLETSTK